MVDIVISVAAKIAEHLVAPVGRPFRYLWNYKTNLENLKNEVEKLEAKRDTVQSLIKPGEDPLPDVKLWREKANRIIVEVSGVVGDNPEQANTQCCKGFSGPNLMNRYQLSKKAADKLKDVFGLEQEAVDFNEVSKPTIPEQTTLRPRKGDEAFESRKSTLKDIIDALRDPDVNMVGIYGMGGVGKTTLAKEVALEAKQHNLFDKTVFVEVSESSEIKNIQGVIAENLGLQFKDETVLGRANRLCDQLKKEGKILLILDNIWKRINLEEVGIPFENHHKGLKLLLTTRSCDVLTNQMESERNFPVHTLPEADAWSLFKNTAGTCVNYPDLQSIASKIVKTCGGMPLAIVAIAKALKNKEEYVWKNALKELKNPSSESFERTMTNEVYTCIKFSYDSLDTDELKKIFLLCSHIGRTYDASIRDLFMYGLGLGFFNGSNTLENAQCKVEDLVKKLKDNSLLLDAPNETSESHSYNISDGERFAMHDVICDVARSIAREKGQVCPMTDDGISCSWARKNILKNCNSITLHNIGELPKDLKLALPQLEFFYMKTTNALSRITDDFFSKMPSLLVLHLIEMNLSPLPTSFSHLVNLQTLCLDKCKLGDIADIGKLEKLEILSFRGSKISELPEEICQLTSIKLLDLNDCSELEIIPQNFLSCFTQLEALYMYNSLIMWEGRGVNIGRILDELKHLRDRLTTLEISIPNVKMSEGLLSPQLKRYKISIDRNRISPPKNSRTLRVKLNTNDNADEVISQLKGIKQLELVADSRDDFTDSKQSVSLDALFSLESLSLRELNFEKICNVPLAAESFWQLRTITVYGCHKLTNIFSFSIDRVLPKLQEIEVSSCKNMEGIFAIEREDDVNNSELIHEIQFSQLCSVSLTDLPQLKNFCHRVKTTPQLQLASSTNDGEIISEDMIDIPKSLFNEKVVFPNLETLEISYISAEKIWHNQLLTMSSSFQNLNRLVLESCHNLKELFPSSMVNSFVQLQYLEISKCSLLEEVVFMEELKEEERKDIQFPFLKEMKIWSCPNFKGFISNDKIGFPSLKAMVIGNCDKFKEFIFNDKVAVSNIEELRIYYMDNLEKIWDNQLVNDSFCKLKSLEVYNCKKLLNVFSSNIYGRLLSLESLTVNRCDSLEEIFDLRELSIYDSQIKLSFANLQKLRVSRCKSLKNLFSASILAKEGVVMEEAPARFLFPKLTSLVLNHLPELRSFYLGRHKVEGPVLKKLELSDCGIHDTDEDGQMQQPSFFSVVEEIGFPSLKEMEIKSCPKLKEFIFNDKVTVPNIEELRIYRMDNLEKIWHNQLANDSFCKLKSLEVFDCKRLLNVFPSNICGRLLSLESLEVSWCNSLEEIFDFRELSIYDSQIMLSFESLQRLEVTHCRSLKNMFSASILAKEGVVMEEAPARFLFPKLTSLELNDLPQLRSFYPGRHKVEGPVLKKLELFKCGIHDTDEDDEDDEEEEEGHDTDEDDEEEGHDTDEDDEDDEEEGHDTDDEGQMQQDPFFFSLVEEAFPCLEELNLDGEHVTILCQGQFPESLFDKLKILQVSSFTKLNNSSYDQSIFPFGIIQRCQNLEELSLSGGHYKEIFPHGEDQTQTKIKTLNLSFLYDLKYIWKQDSKLDLIIQNLEVLNVQGCHSLINLMPPETSFQNLTSLKVKGCDSLINMGTSTVAKSLVQLTEMSISSCKKLTEVIGNHGYVIEDEIIFRKLKGLMLKGLPSLTSFCSWNFTSKFPSLETLTVRQCSKMKIFSPGDLTTEKLQEVKIDYKSVELRLDFDLNTAIQQSYEKANYAKDNGASSSHHFEIDQESIQQSYKEAKQSHEEAAFPCLEVDDSYASEDGELSRTDVPITSLSSPPETSKISNVDSSTKQEGASEIHLKTTESSFSRTDVPITSLSSPPETSKISNEDSSTKQEGASEIPLKMTESSFSRIDVPITSLSSPPETSKISNEDSSTKQEGASEIPLKMTESSSYTDDPIDIRYSQISSLESLKVSEISQLLKLPPRLHTLKIVGCDALESLPVELKLNSIHLQQLYIIDCCVLESFPVDHLPTTLKSLYIRNCRKLKFPSTSKTKQHEHLEHLCIGSSCDSLSSFHLTLFPELRSLAIWDCVNFSSISISKNHMSLDALEIRDCPKLLSFLAEGLHTPNLTSIFLSNCKNLEGIPEPMDKLISLRSFFINGCPELSSIRHGCFPENLSSLCITYCHKLTPSTQWKMHELNNLSCFEIEGGCIDLKSFPEQNLLPSSLNSLRISRLSNLEFLDYKGLECLASLETLKINGCDKLQSFPEEGLPSSVTYLYINECPLLKAKFQNRRGKEWYKIAHVTHIQIDEEVIS